MSETKPDASQNPDLQKLQETLAFLEQDGVSMRQQAEEMGIAVYRLEQRLEKLEVRLRDLNERLDDLPDRGLEPPPHSAGPDISRDPL